MRAAAATSLRHLHDVLASSPTEPCVVLIGTAPARNRVRLALGGRPGSASAAEGGGVRGEALEGLILIEPPSLLTATEVTEIATFLRGLQHAHCLLLAHVCAPFPLVPDSPSDPLAEALALIAEFYSPADWRSFLVVALVGDEVASLEEGVRDALRKSRAGQACSHNFEAPGRQVDAYCVEEAGQTRRLLDSLRSRQPASCDPSGGSSPLLVQFKMIQQQLGQRRPSSRQSNASRRQADLGNASAVSSEVQCGAPTVAQSPSAASVASNRCVEAEVQAVAGHWTVMVLGKTGSGKSHLANLLLGYHAFESGDSLGSLTNEHSVRKGTSNDGRLTVLDTIGFGDTRLPPETVVRSLRDTALEAPQGIDAIMFVMKKERATAVEQEIFAYVTELLFGPLCLPNLYIVMTHAGRLAKDVESRKPWLKENIAASPQFNSMVSTLAGDPIKRIAFIENSNPADADDDDDRLLAGKRQQRALAEILGLLYQHKAAPYIHGIMRKAGELQSAHLQEMRRELRDSIEEDIRREIAKERGTFDQERSRFQEEVEEEREAMKAREAEMQQRFEQEWINVRDEFQARAKNMASMDLEPLAKEVVESTEKKSGRRCAIM